MMDGGRETRETGSMKALMKNETRGALISIVDDEECVRESLSSLIRSVGYKAEDYDSAEDFLTEGKWDETACLILDVRLQGMGGLELQRRLAELEPGRPPIVFISGHATERDQAWATQRGAVAFLRKPFSDETLLGAVKESIARKRRKGEVRPKVCPLCHESLGVAGAPEFEDETLRATVTDVVKTVKPGWTEADGLCGRCWSFYHGLGRMIAVSRNAEGKHGEVATLREGR
jgi:CheY-like chemotaxis protein